MLKRIKKPAVKPELRRQWFKRHEEDGESPPQIAKADGYDVRTVRKQIAVERQEMERKEARSVVLRQALEQHYADLCDFAQKLDLQLTTEGSTLDTMRGNCMWSALHEHLPRSIIWRNLDKWEHLQSEILQLEHMVEDFAGERIESESGFKFTISSKEVGFNKGTLFAIAAYFKATAKEEAEHLTDADFTLSPLDGNFTDVELNPYRIGRFPNQQVPDIQKLIRKLMAEVIRWEEYNEMHHFLKELERVQRVLRDELSVIILRRIVPGRCKYCPL